MESVPKVVRSCSFLATGDAIGLLTSFTNDLVRRVVRTVVYSLVNGRSEPTGRSLTWIMQVLTGRTADASAP
jgi:hypothetical protein